MILVPADIRLVHGEPRVQDLQLATALGFDRPRKIRDLIVRNVPELSSYSTVCPVVGQTSPRGGRPSTEYWLTEPQALLICMFARTLNASTVRKEVITVFMAWRRLKQPSLEMLPLDAIFRELQVRGYGKLSLVSA